MASAVSRLMALRASGRLMVMVWNTVDQFNLDQVGHGVVLLPMAARRLCGPGVAAEME